MVAKVSLLSNGICTATLWCLTCWIVCAVTIVPHTDIQLVGLCALSQQCHIQILTLCDCVHCHNSATQILSLLDCVHCRNSVTYRYSACWIVCTVTTVPHTDTQLVGLCALSQQCHTQILSLLDCAHCHNSVTHRYSACWIVCTVTYRYSACVTVLYHSSGMHRVKVWWPQR
jgi:hypothetical protein